MVMGMGTWTWTHGHEDGIRIPCPSPVAHVLRREWPLHAAVVVDKVVRCTGRERHRRRRWARKGLPPGLEPQRIERPHELWWRRRAVVVHSDDEALGEEALLEYT